MLSNPAQGILTGNENVQPPNRKCHLHQDRRLLQTEAEPCWACLTVQHACELLAAVTYAVPALQALDQRQQRLLCAVLCCTAFKTSVLLQG